MKTDLELAELYDYVYSNPTSNGGLYGFYGRRMNLFVGFIKENLPISSKIIDLGCGRGHMVKWLGTLGYDIEGTEIVDFLFKNDLHGLPVKKLFYSELYKLKDNSFDCVVSNDVIEHLSGEEEVHEAYENFIRISKRYVLISTGGIRAAGSICGNLHEVINPQEWWKNLFLKKCKLIDERIFAGSYFLFGEKK